MIQRTLTIAALCAVAAHADTTLRMRMASGKNPAQETAILTQGERQRIETGTKMTMIEQRDKQQMILVDEEAKTYSVMPTGINVGSATASPAAKKGGVVKVFTEVTDTGERKQMFGYEARHIKSATRQEPSIDACHPGKSRNEIDGWYIDFDAAPQRTGADGGSVPAASAAACTDEYQTENKGSGKLGYPVSYTMKSWEGDAAEPTVMSYEVLALSKDNLDAALFEIPSGYKQAGSAREIATQVVAATQPKRSGVLRVGVIAPAYLNQPLQSAIRSGNLDTVELATVDQARRTECDFVLTAEPDQAAAVAAPAPKKRGLLGNIAKATAGVQPGGEGPAVSYRLQRVADGSEVIRGVESGKTGSGFGLRNAMQLASFVPATGLMSRAFVANPYLSRHLAKSSTAPRRIPASAFRP